MTESRLQIGEVAQRAGVSIDTIRYYEKRSLLPRSPRTRGGFRLFDIHTVERLRFIKHAQEMGFSLDQIKTLVSGGGAGECRQMRDLLKAKLEEISERMKGLRAFMRVLSRHLQTCEAELARHGSTASCPVIVEISHSGNREVKK